MKTLKPLQMNKVASGALEDLLSRSSFLTAFLSLGEARRLTRALSTSRRLSTLSLGQAYGSGCGLRGKMWSVIRDMYSSEESCIMVGAACTDWFRLHSGVQQGCPLSPTLFNVFIDGLARELKRVGVGLPADQRDLLCVLLFADDILLLANSAQGLDQLLGVVQDYCRRWRLELSQTKTKKLVFGRYNDDSVVDDGPVGAGVSETDVYKYLGLLFQREMSWEKAKARVFRNAQKASVWSWDLVMRTGNPTVKGLTGIYTGLVMPYLEYGAEVWGDFEWEEAEVLQRMIGRRILKLNKTVANEVVMGELSWLPLKARRMMLRLFFWLKILGMRDSRWVKQVYLEAKRRLDTHPERVN